MQKLGFAIISILLVSMCVQPGGTGGGTGGGGGGGGGAGPTPGVNATQPDLVITDIIVPSSLMRFNSYNVTVKVKNNDIGITEPYSIILAHNAVPFQWSAIGTEVVSSHPSGTEVTLTYTWNPNYAKTFGLRATADASHIIIESDETNNVLIKNVTVGG